MGVQEQAHRRRAPGGVPPDVDAPHADAGAVCGYVPRTDRQPSLGPVVIIRATVARTCRHHTGGAGCRCC
jgi:hypothetical protein